MSAKIDLKALQSEGRNQKSINIDTVSTEELCRIINDEDQTVAEAVQQCLPVIARAIDALTEVVRGGGKVVYVGAGTSGRLGVLDASELPPTYSAKPEQFVALIAGGDRALRHAQEGAEDDGEQAIRDMKEINLQEGDALIGIAASGRTPYVLSCLEYAKIMGCATVGVGCSSPSAMGSSGNVDFMIEAVTGAEVVTGSTRMKAGTATKLVLNMLSTGVQIRLGKTFGNMMVDVRATNLKLQQRARNILRELCGAECPDTDQELDDLLREASGSVKLAIAMVHLGASAAEARQRLEGANGVLGTLMLESRSPRKQAPNGDVDQEFVLCIDGGGSKCAAYVLGKNGEIGSATGPACNVTTSSLQYAVTTIRDVATQAVKACPALRERSSQDVAFRKVWIGLAGFDRPRIADMLGPMLRSLFQTSCKGEMKVTNDLELLATTAGGSEGRRVCVLVAGTGSIAMTFRKSSTGYVKLGRTGGWGSLIGDDGSGFDIGRKAIRHVLELYEEGNIADSNDDSLAEAVIRHFNLSQGQNISQDILSSVLISSVDSKTDARQKIAEVARVVVQQQTSSPMASRIVASSTSSMSHLVQRVVKSTGLNPADSILVMTGGLLQAPAYRDQLIQAIDGAGLRFYAKETIQKPGLMGAEALLSSFE